MTPEQALSQLSGAGREARVGPVIHRGVSAVSYQAWVEKTSAILRIDRDIARHLGLDRVTELHILQIASQAGLAPQVIDAKPEEGILLTARVVGRHWSEPDLADAARSEQLGHRLAVLHGLDVPDVGTLDLRAAAARYAALSGGAVAERLYAEVEELAGRSSPAGNRACLCHNDLNAGNILIGDGMSFIDYEYAALGDPLFDAGVAIRQLQLETAQRAVFLRALLGGDPSEAQVDHVSRMGALYDRLVLLWRLCLESLGGQPAGWREETARSLANLPDAEWR